MAQSGRPRTGVHARALVVVTGGDAWQASVILEVDGRTTERQFEAESCDAIASAAALILALAADDGLDDLSPPPAPVSRLPASVAPPAFVPSPVAEPGAPPVVLTSAPPPSPARAAVDRSLFVSAEGLVDWGTLPDGAAAGIEVAAGRRWARGRWRASALGGASFFPTQQLPYSQTAGYVYEDFWLAGLFARGCLAAAVWRFELGPCVGAELDVMHGSSSANNPGAVETQTRPWFSAQASARATLKVTPSTAVSLRAGVSVPTTRPDFATANADVIVTVYQIPGIAYRAGLGLEHSF